MGPRPPSILPASLQIVTLHSLRPLLDESFEQVKPFLHRGGIEDLLQDQERLPVVFQKGLREA
jgi:hypothetical protein